MKTTTSQRTAIETAKVNYSNVGAEFEVLGEAKYYPGKVICKLTYANGFSTEVMIGKRGCFEWR